MINKFVLLAEGAILLFWNIPGKEGRKRKAGNSLSKNQEGNLPIDEPVDIA